MADPNDWTRLFAKHRQRADEPDDAQAQAALREWAARLQEDDATAELKLDAELTELLTHIHDPG